MRKWKLITLSLAILLLFSAIYFWRVMSLPKGFSPSSVFPTVSWIKQKTPIFYLTPGLSNLCLINSDGSNKTVIYDFKDNEHIYWFDISHDSNYLLFYTLRLVNQRKDNTDDSSQIGEFEGKIVVYDLKKKSVISTEILNDIHFMGKYDEEEPINLAWSPDSKKFLKKIQTKNADGANHCDIYIVDFITDKSLKIMQNYKGIRGEVLWDQKGENLYFHRFSKPNIRETVRFNLATKSEKIVTTEKLEDLTKFDDTFHRLKLFMLKQNFFDLLKLADVLNPERFWLRYELNDRLDSGSFNNKGEELFLSCMESTAYAISTLYGHSIAPTLVYKDTSGLVKEFKKVRYCSGKCLNYFHGYWWLNDNYAGIIYAKPKFGIKTFLQGRIMKPPSPPGSAGIFTGTNYQFDDQILVLEPSSGKISKLVNGIPFIPAYREFADYEVRMKFAQLLSGSIKPTFLEIFLVDRDVRFRGNKRSDYLFRNLTENGLINNLTNGLTDNHWYIREQSILELGFLSNPQAISQLKPILNDPYPRVRAMTTWTLGHLRSDNATNPLIEALKDNSYIVRGAAVEALGLIGNSKALEHLIAVLKDKEEFVQTQAIIALGILRDKRATNFLIPFLKHPDAQFKMITAEALGLIKDPKAIDGLIYCLNDNWPGVKLKAAQALGNIGNTKALQPLLKLLTKKSNYSDIDEIAKALGNITKLAPDSLFNQLKHPDYAIKVNAIKALGYIGDKKATEPLSKLINERIPVKDYNDHIICCRIIEAYEHLKDEKSIESLLYYWYSNKHHGPCGAYSFTKALLSIGTPKAIDALIKALDDGLVKKQYLSEVINFEEMKGISLDLNQQTRNMLDQIFQLQKDNQNTKKKKINDYLSRIGFTIDYFLKNYSFLLYKGLSKEEKKIWLFILELYGNKNMAESFLNCFYDADLRTAARKWANYHGYCVEGFGILNNKLLKFR